MNVGSLSPLAGRGWGEGASPLGSDVRRCLQRCRSVCSTQNRGEAPSPSFASLARPLPARRGEVKAAVKNRTCPGDRLGPIGAVPFGIQAEPAAKGLVPRKKKCPKIEIVAVENNLCVCDAIKCVRIAFTRSAETELRSQRTSKRHRLPGRQMACPHRQDIDVAQRLP